MKKLIIIALTALTSYSVFAQNEKKAIKVTCEDYVLGWYSADSERMAGALHDNLTKEGLARPPHGQLQFMRADKATMIGYAKRKPDETANGADMKIYIEVFEVRKHTASARITSRDYIDFVQLIKEEGQWKIIHALWEQNIKS